MSFIKNWIFSNVGHQLSQIDNEPTHEDEDDKSSIELDEYIFSNALYSETIFDNIIHDKYRVLASKIVKNVEQWEYNRLIDIKHVDDLSFALKSMKHPHFIGSIKVAKINNSIKLLDGGHRCAAICNLIAENPDFDIYLDVDLYHVNDQDNCDFELLDLFLKANNNKNIIPSDIPENKIIEIINFMIIKWPKNIKIDETKETKLVNKNCLLMKELKNIISILI